MGALLAHGGTAGAIAEGAGILLFLGVLSYLVWRSTRGKIDEYDPTRERAEREPRE